MPGCLGRRTDVDGGRKAGLNAQLDQFHQAFRISRIVLGGAPMENRHGDVGKDVTSVGVDRTRTETVR